MRILRVHAVNFRCLRKLDLALEDVTVLVGANSTGKSTVLHALEWFFHGGPLGEQDISGHQTGAELEVGVTFGDLDPSDRAALGALVTGDEVTLWRTWSMAGGQSLTGSGHRYSGFGVVRDEDKARERNAAYKRLRAERPELELPSATSSAAVEAAMLAWEAEHPHELEEGRVNASALFDGSGLAGRMDFVLVAALTDPDVETRDGRGTLLRQLLDRSLGEQSAMRTRLDELGRDFSDRVYEIMAQEGGAALGRLSGEVTGQLSQFIPGGEVQLSAWAPTLKLPELSVDMRVADAGLDTEVGRQGHGFQRALLIAVVQQLAAPSAQDDQDDGDGQSGDGGSTGVGEAPELTEGEEGEPPASPPALFLALEEPELYQHPIQARHFAATLAALADADGDGAPVQVAYATHSEHFVDPGHYQRLRRFRRDPGADWPQTLVTQATIDGVAARLAGVFDQEQIATRVRITLRRQAAEAVFARAVVLTEGTTDVHLLQGLADRDGGLDGAGIAVIEGHGKVQLLLPWAILTELGVPTYVVFDADAGKAERMRRRGRTERDVEAAVRATRAENEKVLSVLGLEPEGEPATAVLPTCAVLHDCLETEAAAWAGFDERVAEIVAEEGDWREAKSDDAYRQAAATLTAAPPAVFADMLTAIRALAP